MPLPPDFLSYHRLTGSGLLLLAAAFLLATAGMPAAVMSGLPFLADLGMNTALCIGLLGLALAKADNGQAALWRGVHVAVAVIAAAALLQFILDIHPADGLWRLLFNTRPEPGGWPGRMAVAGALVLLLYSGAARLLSRRQAGWIPAFYFLLLAGILIALGGLTGHVTGIVLFQHGLPKTGLMSLLSGTLFLLAGIGIWQFAEKQTWVRDWRVQTPGLDVFIHAVAVLASMLVVGGVAVAGLMQWHESGLATSVILLLPIIGAALLYWRIVPVIARTHQAEAALAASAKQQELLLRHASQGIYGIDAAGRVSFANPIAGELLGYSTAELLGLPMHPLMHHTRRDGSNYPEAECPILATLKDGINRHVDDDIFWHKDGTPLEVIFDVAALREGGHISGAVILFTDVGAHHRTQAELSRAQAQAQLGSWWLDIPTNTLTWSDECYRIFGIPAGTPLTYQSFLACVHPDDRDHVVTMWRAAAHGAPYDVEHRLLVDGQVKWVRERAELEFHPDGTLWRGVGTTQDITKLKHKEDELLRSRQLLRDLAAHHERIREEERTRIAREVHDELGQYLTALRMDASLLLIRFGTDNPGLQQQVAHMKQTIDTTIGVVRNVVTALRPPALDMGLIPAAEWLLASFRERTGTSIQFDAPDHDPGLNTAQTTAVFRILQECLTNISRHAEARQVQVVMRRDGQSFTMRIADDGIGFEPKFIRRRKTFGLMGIRERALAFGGQAKFTSHPGQGATVYLSIPISLESPA